jgi:hypothetical protein
MNTYGAWFKGEVIEVEAETTFAAQTAAIGVFAKKFPRHKVKGYQITVLLAAKDGVPVIHDPAILP